MKLGEIVNVYNVLGEAKTSTLKVEEVLNILRVRKVMRHHVEEWNAFYRDVQEKIQQWEDMSEEQRKEVNKSIEAELAKDIEVEFEKLSEEGIAALIQENGFKVREIDLLGIMKE